MKSLTYIAAIIGLSILSGFVPAYAQNATIDTDATSTPILITPNPFPTVPTEPAPATSTPQEPITPAPTPTTTPEITPTTTEPVVEDVPEEEPAPKPTPAPKPKPVPKPTPKPIVKEEKPATTTASTTEFIPLAPGTILPGNIYVNARHAPLNAETSLYLLGIATLSAILGAFMVEKNRLDRFGTGIAGIFSPIRPLPRPRTERQ